VPTTLASGPSVELRGGTMPLISFGTHPLRGAAATEAVLTAFEVGYRAVDTATRYRNEEAVGEALAATTVPREELFVTTKMPPDQVGFERRTLETSLSRLRVEFVDLWLIHWPPGEFPGVRSWREFQAARDEGLVRDIGVSNYPLELLDGLRFETDEFPAVNQRQWGPGDYDPALEKGLRERGIVLGGHSSLRTTDVDHPVLVAVAAAHGRTVHEVLLRWNLHHGVAVAVKSVRRERMEQNLAVAGFTLSTDEIAAIDAIGGRTE
jgi:2,5-diketo-D-gluconate reductase A